MPFPSLPVYVLVCDTIDKKRRGVVDRVKETFGYAPHIVQGLSKLDPNFSKHACSVNAKGLALGSGQVACATGHIKMLLEFVSSKAPYALILEDDALFTHPASAFHKVFSDLETHAYGLWDWVHFGGKDTSGKATLYPEDHPKYKVAGECVRAELLPWGSWCYGVSRKGAITLLTRVIPLYSPYDTYLRWCGRDFGFQAPRLAKHDDSGPSLILWPEPKPEVSEIPT